MRIHDTPEREHRWERLKEATGESTVAGALDIATKHYLADLEQKRDLVEGLSPQLAAEISTPFLPVEVERTERIGREDISR